MPVIAAADKDALFPEWSETRTFGVHHVKAGAEIEPHFHDCNEYWVIVAGEGDAQSEGVSYHLQPGDMLLTKAGDIHSMAVTDDMIAVTYYGIMPQFGRHGHLHHGIDAAWPDYVRSLTTPL